MSWLKEYLQDRGIIAKACMDAMKVSKPRWYSILKKPTTLTVDQVRSLAYLLKLTPEELQKLVLMQDEIENK